MRAACRVALVEPELAPAAVTTPTRDFSVQLHFPHSLRSVVNSVLEVATEIQVEVVCGGLPCKPRFGGLVVEAISDVCMIVAYLSGEVEVDPRAAAERARFLVSAAPLHTCLKGVTPSQQLRVERYAGTSDFEISTREPAPSTASSNFRLTTWNKPTDTMRLDDMRFDYAVEFEMPLFRSVIKTAKDLQAERVRLRIIERAGRPSFVVSCVGKDASVEHTFDSVEQLPAADDGSGGAADLAFSPEPAAVAPAPAPQDRDVVVRFDEEFPADKLHVFIKSVDKSTVSMQLAQGKPLLMSYTLGDPDSSMSFILVPYSCIEQ